MKVVFALLGLILVGYAAAQSLQEQCAAGLIPGTYHPHNELCNMFYTCSIDGYWRANSCYSPYLWNQDLLGCDYPDNVNCGNLVS